MTNLSSAGIGLSESQVVLVQGVWIREVINRFFRKTSLPGKPFSVQV
jgi:hypothetical protein